MSIRLKWDVFLGICCRLKATIIDLSFILTVFYINPITNNNPQLAIFSKVHIMARNKLSNNFTNYMVMLVNA